MKHRGHKLSLTTYDHHSVDKDVENLRNFDDRTLSSLIGRNVAHPDDELADVVRSLDRWQDRKFRA